MHSLAGGYLRCQNIFAAYVLAVLASWLLPELSLMLEMIQQKCPRERLEQDPLDYFHVLTAWLNSGHPLLTRSEQPPHNTGHKCLFIEWSGTLFWTILQGHAQ